MTTTTEPGRPRPRERADHDLAADHPGRAAALRGLDVWYIGPAGRKPVLEQMLDYGEPYGDVIESMHTVALAARW